MASVDATVEELLAIAEREIASQQGAPGIVVGATSRSDERIEGCGRTNVDHPLAVTPDTMYQLASISKVVTAHATVTLAADGVIDLDAPLTRHLPELKSPEAADITLRHLLSHTAGRPGDFELDTGRGDDALELLLPEFDGLPQWLAPGRAMTYSNLGYAMVGVTLARATRTPFETLVRDVVLAPLGMDATAFFLEDVVFRRWAAGHVAKDGAPAVAPWWRPRNRCANGGLLAPMTDVLALGRAHLTSVPEGMADPVAPIAPGTRQCLGWRRVESEGAWALSHGGITPGYAALMFAAPTADLAIAALINATPAVAVIRELSEAMAAAVGVARPKPVSRPVETVDVAALEGEYHGYPQGALRIMSRADELWLTASPPDGDEASRLSILSPRGADVIEFQATDGRYSGTHLATADVGESRPWLRLGARLLRRVS